MAKETSKKTAAKPAASTSDKATRNIRPGRLLDEVEAQIETHGLTETSTIGDLINAIERSIINEVRGR